MAQRRDGVTLADNLTVRVRTKTWTACGCSAPKSPAAWVLYDPEKGRFVGLERGRVQPRSALPVCTRCMGPIGLGAT